MTHIHHIPLHSIPKYGVNLARFSDSAGPVRESTDPSKGKKISIFQKMKQLAKDYWHILVPVHLITSAVWVAVFYTAVTKYVRLLIEFE